MYVYAAHNDFNNNEAEMWQCMLDDYSSVFRSFTTTKTPLENRHTYKFYGFLYNNDILFDETKQQIYVANGGHSNISVLSYESEEPVVMHPGFNWISIPRHTRTNGNSTPTPNVFGLNMVSPDYDMMEIEYNYLNIIMSAGVKNEVSAINGGLQWSYEDPTMQNIISTRGYVVVAEPKNDRVLLMEGTVEDPETEIELYCKKENWIGYFIPEKQNVFDALSDIIDDVYHIQMEECNCWRHNYPISNVCGSKSTDDYSPGTWICDGRPVIDYAQMVKVSPELDILDFKWSYSGSSSDFEERPEVEYYEYEKSAGYETFVIILDTTQTIPTEIGAFVNNSCVGATAVMSSDTVVVLSAYLESIGDSVTFEQYYGGNKSTNKAINNYFVKNTANNSFTRRVIYSGKKQEAFIISFADKKQPISKRNL